MKENNNLLQEEILESINKIDQVTMEAEYNVLNALLNDYHKSMMIYEQYQGNNIEEFTVFQECFVQEGFSDIVKKGIDKGKAVLIKIWNVIKKLLVFISRQVMRLINFLKRIFKKGVKSADQILDELGVKPNKSIFTESASERKPRIEHIRIPSSKLSKVDLGTVDLIFDNIKTKFENDKVVISYIDAAENFNNRDNRQYKKLPPLKEHIKSQSVVTSPGWAVYFIKYFDNSDRLFKLISLMSDIILGIKSDNSSIKTFNNEAEWLMSLYPEDDIEPTTSISLKEMISFQNKINHISNLLNNFSDPSIPIDNYGDNELIYKMNDVVEIVNTIFMSLNSLTSILQNSNIIDGEFKHSITDVKVLGYFVDKMINAGFPSKYVSYNAWLVSSFNLTSDGKSSEYDPIWGQSRVIFFPKDINIIYKVALSGMGVSSNRTEYKVTKTLGKEVNKAPITPIIDNYNNIIVSAPRIFPTLEGVSASDKICDKLEKELNSLLKSKNTKGWDIYGNVGYDPVNKRWVIFDYGWIQRI